MFIHIGKIYTERKTFVVMVYAWRCKSPWLNHLSLLFWKVQRTITMHLNTIHKTYEGQFSFVRRRARWECSACSTGICSVLEEESALTRNCGSSCFTFCKCKYYSHNFAVLRQDGIIGYVKNESNTL